MKRNKIYKSNDYLKLLPFVLLGFFVLSSILYIGYMIGKNQANKSQEFKEIAIAMVSPTPTLTPTPTVVVIPQPQKVALWQVPLKLYIYSLL